MARNKCSRSAKCALTLKEVLQAGQKPRKRQPPKQKFRNPDKPSETWSGRGKKPAWVEKAEDEAAVQRVAY